MILDTTKKKGTLNIPPKRAKPKGGQSESMLTSDVVEVELIRGGKTISKGR